MNVLSVGAETDILLQYVPNDNFLVIDDGPFIDRIWVKGREFDPNRHSFNIMRGMDDRKAYETVSTLKSIYPEGENTLTKATAEFQILKALKNKPRKLSTLIPDTKETQYAYQMIEKLLLFDVLKNVLDRPSNFRLTGTIFARLNRAELTEFECFAIANFLISQYQGTVVIPDFGSYASPFHLRLIRQNRLIAGIASFDEVPKLRNHLLQIETKIASRCTPQDAMLLAMYRGITPHTVGYGDYIHAGITGSPFQRASLELEASEMDQNTGEPPDLTPQ